MLRWRVHERGVRLLPERRWMQVGRGLVQRVVPVLQRGLLQQSMRLCEPGFWVPAEWLVVQRVVAVLRRLLQQRDLRLHHARWRVQRVGLMVLRRVGVLLRGVQLQHVRLLPDRRRVQGHRGLVQRGVGVLLRVVLWQRMRACVRSGLSSWRHAVLELGPVLLDDLPVRAVRGGQATVQGRRQLLLRVERLLLEHLPGRDLHRGALRWGA